MKINLFGDTGESWNDSISASECINMVPMYSKTKDSLIFQKFPGTKEFFNTAVGTDEIISIFPVTNRLSGFTDRLYFVVYDGANYELHSYYSSGSHYTHTTNLTYGKHLFALDHAESGGKLLIGGRSTGFDIVTLGSSPTTDSITTTTGVAGENPSALSYFDGYFFMTTSGRKIYSTEFGGTSFSSTRFGLVTTRKGNIVKHESDERELTVYCEDHIEHWYNAGASGFPLLRNKGAINKVGLFGKNSLIKFGDTSIFIGIDDNRKIGVYSLTGYDLKNITPSYINAYLNGKPYTGNNLYIADAKDAHARPIILQDYSMYMISFPNSSVLGTWGYNLESGLWCREKSGSDGVFNGVNSPEASLDKSQYMTGGAVFINQIGVDRVEYYNVVIPAKDNADPHGQGIWGGSKLHYYDETENNEEAGYLPLSGFDTYRPFVITSNYIVGKDEMSLSHIYLKLKFIPPGDTATVRLYYSDDDGATWVNYGDFDINSNNGLIEARRLGASKRRLYKLESYIDITYSSGYNIPITLTDAYIEVEQLAA